MREPIDPFASVGTSNVFFQVVLGRKTPTHIAESLESHAPNVVEHLHRLREMGVVDLGDKDGKFQNYEIKWRKFVVEFLDHIYTPWVQEAFLRSVGDEKDRREVERERKLMEEITGELKKNEQFRELLREYFERLANDMDRGLYPKRSIWGAIYCFEESLGSVSSMMKSTKKPETRKLLTLLEKWNQYRQRFRQYGPRAALNSSVQAVGESAKS